MRFFGELATGNPVLVGYLVACFGQSEGIETS
jgi:hypothetical protein